MEGIAKIGLLGGGGGDPCDIQHRPRQLVSVSVYANDYVINALKFKYVDDTGVQRTVGEWGKRTVPTPGLFELGDGEYLKEISVTYGPYMDAAQCITSLKFVTNTRRESPRFGKVTGEVFKIPVAQESKIVAFFGSAGDVIDALGLYVLP